jgi:hypothetical protein
MAERRAPDGERFWSCNQDGDRDFCTNELARPTSVWPDRPPDRWPAALAG